MMLDYLKCHRYEIAKKTAPYMHDGSFETLEEVVEHYNSGGKITQIKALY